MSDEDKESELAWNDASEHAKWADKVDLTRQLEASFKTMLKIVRTVIRQRANPSIEFDEIKADRLFNECRRTLEPLYEQAFNRVSECCFQLPLKSFDTVRALSRINGVTLKLEEALLDAIADVESLERLSLQQSPVVTQGTLEKAAIRKLKRLGTQLVREFGSKSDLRALAYQNSKRFPRDFWLSVSDIPTNKSGMVGGSTVWLSSETTRWLIYKSDGRWRDLIKEFDSCIRGMPATYFERLGFDRLPEHWLDFLVEYGLLEHGMFRLQRFYDPLHPICIHQSCFLGKGEIGNLAGFGVKSMGEITSLDSGWWTEEFDPIKMTIQTLEEILDCELFDDVQVGKSFSNEPPVATKSGAETIVLLRSETGEMRGTFDAASHDPICVGQDGDMLFLVYEDWVVFRWKSSEHNKQIRVVDARIISINTAIQWCDSNGLEPPFELMKRLPRIDKGQSVSPETPVVQSVSGETPASNESQVQWESWSDWMDKSDIVDKLKLGVWKTLVRNNGNGDGVIQVENNPDNTRKGRFRKKQVDKLALETGTSGISGQAGKSP